MEINLKKHLRCRWILFLAVLFIYSMMIPTLVEALFEDQAFKFDWRQQFIGKPNKLISWQDTSSSRSDLVIAVTESNVLAAVYAESGKLK